MEKTQEELRKEFLSIKSFTEYCDRREKFKDLIQDSETAFHMNSMQVYDWNHFGIIWEAF